MTDSAQPAQPRVTLAVLNFNGRRLLERTLPSVVAQAVAGGVRVVVVDDASTDDSLSLIRERWPGVGIVALTENRGITAALNRGVQAAETEFVALLNNDVELADGWLEQLVASLDAHPEAASATGKLMRYDDRQVIDAAGDVLLWSSAVFNRGYGELDRGQYDKAQDVFSACGGAALYRREAFASVGPFDESFGAYLEDIDWGTRARLAGHTCRYVPEARGFHMRGATTRGRGAYVSLQRRNQLLLVTKNLPASVLVRHGWKILLHQLILLGASVRDRQVREQFEAWSGFLVALPGALRSRRAIQASRRVGRAELEAAIAASLPVGRGPGLLFELAPLSASRRRGSRV
jgi:GT2 family glycosyltransferase